MPKNVSATLLPYFYKRSQTVLTGFQFDLDDNGTFETLYVANNENIGSYTALAIKRGTITSEDGTVLNEIEIGLDNVDLAFKQWILGGSLERKPCKIVMLFVSANKSILGTVTLYHGVIDAPKGDENWVTVTLRPFEMLEREYPQRIYQTGCNWRFGERYNNTCGLNLNDYQYAGTLSAESDGTTLTIAHGKATNYFVPGYVLITDGDYENETRPVLSNDGGSVDVRVSFGHTIPSGTGIRLQKMCAKNPQACQEVFNNYSNYGGFNSVPKSPII